MCGIGVYINKEKKINTDDFHRSMQAIIHRGPDSQKLINVTDHIVFANNRLAIIDNHPRSNQPFQYKHYTITFNGAIYNFKEIREKLIQNGHVFHTESDTELILHAFEEYGQKCVDLFNGMWAFVIFNNKDKSIFISRDRFGIKPLYYYYDHKSFYIVSEIKQFLFIPNLKLEINNNQVQYFIESGGFKNNSHSTFYNNIYQLDPGCNLLYNYEDHSFNNECYYSINSKENIDLIPLNDLINRSVIERGVADIKPAILFSGGIDSAILMYHVLTQNPQSKSYSFIETKDSILDESKYINSFLKKYPHENHQVSLPDTLDSLIKKCISFQDEPIASLSVVAQYLLYKLASQNGEKLMLSGQGSDEIFGGYPRFLSYIPRGMFFANLGHLPSFMNTNSTYLFQYVLGNKDRQVFNSNVYKATTCQTQKSYMNYLISTNGLRDLLHYEDRNSMANSIETRLPFLDHRLVEFAYHMPIQLKLEGLKTKGALREVYKNILPSEIINRKNKLAFDTPEKKLLLSGVLDPAKVLSLSMSYFPDLPWNNSFKLDIQKDYLLIWQLHFLNIWFQNIHNE